MLLKELYINLMLNDELIKKHWCEDMFLNSVLCIIFREKIGVHASTRTCWRFPTNHFSISECFSIGKNCRKFKQILWYSLTKWKHLYVSRGLANNPNMIILLVNILMFLKSSAKIKNSRWFCIALTVLYNFSDFNNLRAKFQVLPEIIPVWRRP